MALIITDVPEECIATVIRVTRIGELGTMIAVTGNQSTLGRNAAAATTDSSSSSSLQHASVATRSCC
jgi:hypothetical protein